MNNTKTAVKKPKWILEDLVESPMPTVGPVKIKRDAFVKWFDEWQITQHGSGFRLIAGSTDLSEGFAISLSSDDAFWCIDKFKLIPSVDSLFRRLIRWE